MKGFVLHPDAYKDLEEIWEYVSADNPQAADRILEEIRQPFIVSFNFLARVTSAPT